MANPNVGEPSFIYGNNAFLKGTTTPTAILSNPANSNKVYKVNTIFASCLSTGNTTQANLVLYTGANLTGTAYQIVGPIVLPPFATIVMADVTSAIYIKENQSLGFYAPDNNQIDVSVSWEEIS